MLTVAPAIASRAIPHLDPVAMSLLEAAVPTESLGSFPRTTQLGFIDPATIATTYSVVRAILGGPGDQNSIKRIYQQIPQSMIRVTGGNGKWTDTVTHETMNDLATEVRKVAMMASALGIYVNHDNWFFDDTTGQHLSPGAVLARWQKLFGNSDFASAYSKFPELFRVFGPDPSLDPVISSAGKVENAGPLPVGLRSGDQFGQYSPSQPMVGAPGSTPGVVPTGAGAAVTPSSTAGLSPMVIALLVGGVVVVSMLSGRKKA